MYKIPSDMKQKGKKITSSCLFVVLVYFPPLLYAREEKKNLEDNPECQTSDWERLGERN